MARKEAPAPSGDQPPEGCVFMWRKDTDGSVRRAEVESLCGSVDVMADQGWSVEPIKES